MSIGQDEFVAAAKDLIDQLVTTQRDAIAAAAVLVADCVLADGVVQAFGTGHSQGLVMEIAGRAGGLIPTNRLALRDVVTYGGDPADSLGPHTEREPAIAHRVYDLAAPGENDLFVIASNSGGNGSTVEMASLVKERGHRLIAFTSLAHATAVESRHPSGNHLHDYADVVIDNCGPMGDTLLPMPGGGQACAISSITAAFAAQMMLADACARLLSAGTKPPVYLSANVPGGDDHNKALEAHYSGRIRRDP
ncbi:sugar isomerase domain-containing protein [Kutzneria sp. CA-103260]|uniref:sugar isomerase domain-containing protein n=1 Tax=Kutzneria sp. CA-103260 TaxID=2802641 RepID=UPI001BA78C94|nr:SIS domain-containing protein [Kutzneria sp. CA-103260]QUQ68160.1 sugar isomerase domain-containing protein [Kutzneria sp. CA-103260]